MSNKQKQKPAGPGRGRGRKQRKAAIRERERAITSKTARRRGSTSPFRFSVQLFCLAPSITFLFSLLSFFAINNPFAPISEQKRRKKESEERARLTKRCAVDHPSAIMTRKQRRTSFGGSEADLSHLTELWVDRLAYVICAAMATKKSRVAAITTATIVYSRVALWGVSTM